MLAVFGLGAADRTLLPVAAAAGIDDGHALDGQASYYAPQFSGRPMANGQRFDPASNTAAHRTLPFGTRVRLTNTANGRTAEVVIADRGPFSHRRIFDLSPRTADELGMRRAGVARVVAQPLGRQYEEVAEAR
ncbi:septal ring lytic transglycosylase RlpA family protein [Dankookia rubra]|uniref:Endolytic peptidoglycan transglycosylase RlpA n=2 Tax=Dankookia rubra TaxID=1442381 RepID=A0A4R5Q6M3_9PROT|nr:septal ring lytic transglycosylase RlpA family protein [Dankookia rubra]